MKTVLLTMGSVVWLVWVAGLLVFRRRPELRVGTAREFFFPVAALLLTLVWLLSDVSNFGFGFLSLYVRWGLIIGALLSVVWLFSLVRRDCGIMDVAYPLAVAVPVVVLLVRRGNWSAHEYVIAALVTLWSLRMSAHIGLRNTGHGEDGRYAAWRRRFGRPIGRHVEPRFDQIRQHAHDRHPGGAGEDRVGEPAVRPEMGRDTVQPGR